MPRTSKTVEERFWSKVDKTKSCWIINFPLPPSVNSYLTPIVVKGRGRLVKSKIHRQFMEDCHIYRLRNHVQVRKMEDALKNLKLQCEQEGRTFALRVDAYFVFHVERIQANDANNRLKPVLDGLVRILDVDDRFYYAGECEKIITTQRNLECAIIRISPMTPRTLEQLKAQIALETSIRGS